MHIHSMRVILNAIFNPAIMWILRGISHVSGKTRSAAEYRAQQQLESECWLLAPA